VRPIALSILTALLLVLLSACTRPSLELPPDRLATQAAATRTFVAAMVPSATPPPSATPIQTAAPEETATPTAALLPTETLPSYSEDDQRHGLEYDAPSVYDDFSVRYRWGEPWYEGAYIYWENDSLHAVDHWTDNYVMWSTSLLEAGDFYVEITAYIETCEGNDSYGIAGRINGDLVNSGYTLEFSCDGAYRFRKFIGGSVISLIDWIPNPSISAGSNQENRIGLLARGNNLYAYANDTFLGGIVDPTFRSGLFGLFSNALQTEDLSVIFDDFRLWYLAP